MLNIVVFVKQVPNTTQVKTDPVTHNLVRDGVPSVVNPFDLFAIEEAVRLKEKAGGQAMVTAVSMGPPQAEEVLYYALAMGADRGILLTDRAFAGADTLATSYTLSCAAKTLGNADLILTGKQAADGDTAQVPVELAQHFGCGCLTAVTEIARLAEDHAEVFCQRESGLAYASVALPAVLTLEKGINEPRYPRVKDMVRASRMAVEVWQAETIGADPHRLSRQGSPTQVVAMFTPDKTKKALYLEGEPKEMAEKLAEVLKLRGLLEE